MEIFRTKNPIVVNVIKDQLMGLEAQNLCERMVAEPDSVYVVIAVDGGEIISHVVAFVTYNEKFVDIVSAKSSHKLSKNDRQRVIQCLQQWCIDEFNIHEIRIETLLDPKFFIREYGFKKYSVIMSKTF